MAQAYLSLERAKSLVEEIVSESPPGTRNPSEGKPSTLCVYWCETTRRRCIVGELLHRMGMPAPGRNGNFDMDYDGVGVDYVEKGYMSKATVDWLNKVQNVFDGPYLSQSPTWRQALTKCQRAEWW